MKYMINGRPVKGKDSKRCPKAQKLYSI